MYNPVVVSMDCLIIGVGHSLHVLQPNTISAAKCERYDPHSWGLCKAHQESIAWYLCYRYMGDRATSGIGKAMGFQVGN